MNIVLWPTYYLPNIGGLEIMVHALAVQLQKMGHKIIVISNHADSDEPKEYSIEKITVYSFPFVTTLLQTNLLLFKKIMARIHQILNEFSPDVMNVHGWFENFCFYQTRALEKRKIPLCITIHGLLEQKHYHTQSCLKLWSMASAINTVSHALIEPLSQQGFHHQSLQVIYNGLTTPTIATKPFDPNQQTLVMIGRLSEEKCFDIAFYAIKELTKKYPKIKLILVGGGIQFNYLFELKNSLQLDQHIEMTDFVRPDQVQHYIDQASVVLIPSYYESFSLVALQAAMRARVVVASQVYGLTEVVEHNKTGLLVKAKNPTAFANAIDYLFSNPEKIIKMGKAAKQRSKLFTIENAAQQYINLYEKIREKSHATAID